MLAFFFVFVILVGVAPSVSASSPDSQYFDLLDYGTLNDSGSNSGNSNGPLKYKLPYPMDVYAVDILISIYPESGSLTSASIEVPGDSMSLSVYHIDGYLYRLYGHISSSPFWNASEFELMLYGMGAYGVEFHRFIIHNASHETIADYGSIDLNGNSAIMSGPGQSASVNSNLGSFAGRLYFSDWRKYDRVDFMVGIMVGEVVDVYASVGNVPVPVDVTYFSEASGTRQFYATLSVDLTDVSRDLTDRLTVYVDGISDSQVKVFTLYSVNGVVYLDPPSPLVYWFSSLFGKLGSWFDGVKNTVSTGFSNLANWLSSGFQSVVNKLDELIDGSSDGTSDQIKDDLGSVGDFEDRYHDTVEGNWGDVSGSLDQVVGGSNFIGAASFYSDIVQTIFESVPDYGVVLTAVLCVFVVFSLL